MLLTKILFIILILICAAFYVLYIWDFALVLLAVMAALPLIMLLCLFIAKHMISAEFILQNRTASKSSSLPIQLSVTNKSIFPIGKAEAYLEYYNVFNNAINSFELHLPIQPRNTQRITFQLSSEFCGIIKVKCVKIYIYDPLRIFRLKAEKNIVTEFAVMPEGHNITGTVSFTDRINEESELYSQHSPGDDPSEIFDLRDYCPGDRLNRIHWKLSSKKDDFIVKDYSLPIDAPSVVFLDLKCYEDSDDTLQIFDTMAETFLSVSRFLIENERIHTIVYYNAEKRAFVSRLITDHDSLSSAIREFICSISDNLYCEKPSNYFASEPGLSLSSFTYITSVVDKQIYGYIDEELDADIKNIIVILKSADISEAAPQKASAVSTIPVVIGKISASIKDIEL